MKTIYTIGHSTRTTDEFLRLLQRHAITAVADVRLNNASQLAGFLTPETGSGTYQILPAGHGHCSSPMTPAKILMVPASHMNRPVNRQGEPVRHSHGFPR
jgi:uncharacterized protein (DUF488 family)